MIDPGEYEVPDPTDLAKLEVHLAETRGGRTSGGSPVGPAGGPVLTRGSESQSGPGPIFTVSPMASPDAAVGPSPGPEKTPELDSTTAIPKRGLPLPELARPAQGPRAEAARETDLDGKYPDAYFATFGTAVSRAISNRQGESGRMVRELVFGGDDRVQLQNVQSFPYRWLCSLIITAGNGTTWLGTGWLASPRVVITAGHCVYLHNQGGWARQVVICPERNGNQRPYAFVSTQPRSVAGWVSSKAPEQDYGAMILEPADGGHGLGYMGFGAYGDPDLYGLLANVTGYPSDKEPGTLWGHTRTLADIRPRTFIYDIDTYGGMSGARVIRWDGSDYIVIGIHNYGDLAGNQATRITPEVYQNIQLWNSTAP